MLESRSKRGYEQFTSKIDSMNLEALETEFASTALNLDSIVTRTVHRSKRRQFHESPALCYEVFMNHKAEPSCEGLLKLLGALLIFNQFTVRVESHLSLGDDACGDYEIELRSGRHRIATVEVRQTTERSARLAALWHVIRLDIKPLCRLLVADFKRASSEGILPGDPPTVTSSITVGGLRVTTNTNQIIEYSLSRFSDCEFPQLPKHVIDEKRWWHAACSAIRVAGKHINFTFKTRDSASVEYNRWKDVVEINWGKPIDSGDGSDQQVSVRDDVIQMINALHGQPREIAGLAFLYMFWPALFDHLLQEMNRIKIEEVSEIEAMKGSLIESSRYLRSTAGDLAQWSDRSICKDVKLFDFRISDKRLTVVAGDPISEGDLVKEGGDAKVEASRLVTDKNVDTSDLMAESIGQDAVMDPESADSFARTYLTSNFKSKICRLISSKQEISEGQSVSLLPQSDWPEIDILHPDFDARVSHILASRNHLLEWKQIFSTHDEFDVILSSATSNSICRVYFERDTSTETDSIATERLVKYLGLESLYPSVATKIALDTLLTCRKVENIADGINKEETKTDLIYKEIHDAKESIGIQQVSFEIEILPNITIQRNHSKRLEDSIVEKTCSKYYSQGKTKMQESESASERHNKDHFNFFPEFLDTSERSDRNSISSSSIIGQKIDNILSCPKTCGLIWLEDNPCFAATELQFQGSFVNSIRSKISSQANTTLIKAILTKHNPADELDTVTIKALHKSANIRLSFLLAGDTMHCYNENNNTGLWQLRLAVKQRSDVILKTLMAVVSCRLFMKDNYASWISLYQDKFKSQVFKPRLH